MHVKLIALALIADKVQLQAPWVNDILHWLHKHYGGAQNVLRATWLRSMNDAAKKLTASVRTMHEGA
mgnify:CR=1 FL=1